MARHSGVSNPSLFPSGREFKCNMGRVTFVSVLQTNESVRQLGWSLTLVWVTLITLYAENDQLEFLV
ncbi:hypothetical protein XELAEV_18000045mg [Xenopus laevis]|uniref:Uncharacterized protein n=1 Tax=Xenopus laevis TaxID=8355 RepID=A0A974GYW2_XENLA|nr:hypothetical protein XELAEV_18000045mg [Xenopus laevis]